MTNGFKSNGSLAADFRTKPQDTNFPYSFKRSVQFELIQFKDPLNRNLIRIQMIQWNLNSVSLQVCCLGCHGEVQLYTFSTQESLQHTHNKTLPIGCVEQAKRHSRMHTYKGQVTGAEEQALQAKLPELNERFQAGTSGDREEYEHEFKEIKELIEKVTQEKRVADSRGIWRKRLTSGGAQIKELAATTNPEAEKWYKAKYDTLKSQASKFKKDIKIMREEINKYSFQVTDLENHIDALRAQNEALEKQLEEKEAHHLEKVAGLQEIIVQLECELLETKTHLSMYL
ncbi:protein artemis [Platysternon megacephalum]|uniref:Protein artemis n=1 Tax=Platysternon megacephalum TaxID=55544 RepID=A0A4D9ES95_9SAUR|nr:protein artemis [Platysternon megacephalum]